MLLLSFIFVSYCVSLWLKAFLTKTYYFVFFAIIGEEDNESASVEFIYNISQGDGSIVGK